MFRNSNERYSENLYSDIGVKTNIAPERTAHLPCENQEISGGLFVYGQIAGQNFKFLVDTGASISVLGKQAFEKLPDSVKSMLKPHDNTVLAAGGTRLSHVGDITLELSLNGQVTVCNFLVADISDDGILGLPFLADTGTRLDFGRKEFIFNEQTVDCFDRENQCISQTVRCAKTVTIPARCQMIITGKTKLHNKGSEMILEPSKRFVQKKGLLVAKTVCEPKGVSVCVRVCNVMNEPMVIYKNTHLGVLCNAETVSVVQSREPAYVNRVQVSQNTVPDHLIDLYDRSVSELPKQHHKKVAQLLVSNADVFSKNEHDLGQTDVIFHDINTGLEAPIKQAPRRFPAEHEKEIERQLNELLKNGLIQPGHGPWGSPLVLVKKKDGSIRMCVDYRKLNAKTVKDAYPLPRIDDTLDSLANARVFATLDLASGYHQVRNTPRAKVKSAMITKQGLFDWNVMSFGLTGAPATFQRLMEEILRGLNYEILLVYLDDVIVMGSDVDQLIERLQTVFDRLRGANLKLKPKKCTLFRKQVEFLGHVVSSEGIATDPTKTDRVKAWPVPTNISEVRSFLGLCGYYRKFVPDYYTKAKPLHDLTKKPRKDRAKFEWTSSCDDAFNSLKQALTSAPILGYPKDEGRYVLDCDASDHSIGAVLSQVQNGREVVLAYSSKSLAKEQRKYCVTRKEFFAIVFHLKYFRNYLWGRDILVRTDHGALQWYRSFRYPDCQLASWIETVEEYGPKIVSRPGTKHQNADALSRIPKCSGKKCICDSCQENSETNRVDVATNTGGTLSSEYVSYISIESGFSVEELVEAQKLDPAISVIYGLKSDESIQPTFQDIAHHGSETKCYWGEWDRIVLKNGLLYRRWESPDGSVVNWQVILPKKLRDDVLRRVHEKSGHLGQRRCYVALRKRFFWFKFREELCRWIRTCELCQRNKAPPRYNRAKLQTFVVGTPMERIALDVCGPFPVTDRGNVCCLVIGDYFSKWIEAYPLPNQEAETVAEVLVREWVCRYGVPKVIHSDQGSNFESKVFQKVCELLNIEKSRTTPGRPQSDGMIERFNRTLMNIVTGLVAQDQCDWDLNVQLAAMYYRATEHTATGETPNSMLFGREITQPVDLLFNFLNEEETINAPVYVTNLQNRLIKTHQVIERRLVRAAQVAKRYYDSKSNHGKYKRGDLVLVYDPTRKKGLKNKMRALWVGPYVIIKALSNVTYRIGLNRNSKKWKVVHFDKLRVYNPREPVDISWLDGVDISDATAPPDQPDLSLFFEPETDAETDPEREIDINPNDSSGFKDSKRNSDQNEFDNSNQNQQKETDLPDSSMHEAAPFDQGSGSSSRVSTPISDPLPRRPARTRRRPLHFMDYELD